MKGIIEFDLPMEREEFDEAVNGWKYSLVLWELDQWLRGKLKYENLTDDEYEIYDETREKLWAEMESRGVTFE